MVLKGQNSRSVYLMCRNRAKEQVCLHVQISRLWEGSRFADIKWNKTKMKVIYCCSVTFYKLGQIAFIVHKLNWRGKERETYDF